MENSVANQMPPKDGGPIVVWVVLLFTLIAVCELPFFIGGVTVQTLGKLPLSSLLGVLCIAGFILVGYTPSLSALLVAKFHPQGGGVQSVVRRARIWRVGVGWYAIALFGPALLFLLNQGVILLLGGAPPKHWFVLPSSGFLPGSMFFAFMGVLAGTFGEEFGWRGFAQPRLQQRYGALAASLLTGVVWGTFHLWIMPLCPHCMSITDVVVTQYLRMIATAVIYAWLYNSSGGSLFLVMLAHGAYDVTIPLMPEVGGGPIIIALSEVAVAIVVVLVTDPRTLTLRRVETQATQATGA